MSSESEVHVDSPSSGIGSVGFCGGDTLSRPDLGLTVLPANLSTGIMPPAILPFQGISRPTPTRPSSFNDDLAMSTFLKGAKIRAGLQRRGIQYIIPDAQSELDHVDRASRGPFRLSDRIPHAGGDWNFDSIYPILAFRSGYPIFG